MVPINVMPLVCFEIAADPFRKPEKIAYRKARCMVPLHELVPQGP